MQHKYSAIQSSYVECNRCHSSMFLDEYDNVLFWHCMSCGNVVFIDNDNNTTKYKYKKYFVKAICRTCKKEFIKHKSDQYLCSECSKKGQRYYERTCISCGKNFYAKYRFAKYCIDCLYKARAEFPKNRRNNGKSKSDR